MQPRVRLQDIRKPTINKSRRRRRTVSRSIKSLINTVPDANTPVIVFPNVSSFRSVARRPRVVKERSPKRFYKEEVDWSR